MDRVRAVFGRPSGSANSQSSARRPAEGNSRLDSTVPTRGGSTPRRARSHAGRSPPPQQFSDMSSSAVSDSLWFSSDFMLGAGMVIIQPSTGKVVLVYESTGKYWFLPKGRKDIGETLEQAALREAYEESGYQVEFLPLFIPTNAPPPPGSHEQHRSPITEPIYVSTFAWKPRRRINGAVPGAHGGEYLTFWYAGQIPEDAVHHLNTGMPDEQDYQSHSLNIEDALQVLDSTYQPVEHHVLATAYELWRETQKILTERSQ